jgi:NADH dehydrogenase FAD-containing subunit
MNHLETLKKSLAEQIGPRIARAHDCINNLNYSFRVDEVDLAEVIRDLESILRHVRKVGDLEAEYAALDAKADDLMIPQLMEQPTAQERFDALVVPSVPAPTTSK